MKKNNILLRAVKFVAIIGVVVFAMNQCFKSNTEGDEDNEKHSSINIKWHSPSYEELNVISRILVANNISGCGEYRVGKYRGETKIACSRDGQIWIYYDIWEASENINRTPTDEYERFNKPE